MDHFLIAQILGVMGTLAICTGIQHKEKSKILPFNILASIFFSLQYVFLGAVTGLAINVFAVFKFVAFYYKAQNQDKISENADRWILVILMVMNTVVGILAFESMISVFPIMATLIGTYGMWQKNTRVIRIGVLVISTLWIIYNLYVLAYTGILASVIIMIATTVAIIRYDILKRKVAAASV